MLANSSTHRDRTRAFTLVEVLIVIVIIGILAALSLPAINSAIRKARIAQEHNDISQISLALQEFKNKYGVYPPSRIRLRENTAYLPTDDFDVHSRKWLTHIWPDIQLPTGATNGPTILWCKDSINKDATTLQSGDLQAPGDPEGTTYELEGDECLVFFLGGIAEFDRTDPSRPIILHGFTDNPRNPGGVPNASDATTLSRVGALYKFDAGRLIIRAVSSRTPNDFATVTDPRTEKLPCYRPRLVPAEAKVGYAYFSSYEGVGYRPRDCEYEAEPVIFFQEKWPALTTDGGSVNHPETQGPNPYTVTVAAPDNTSAIIKPFAEETFQIISPGGDELFGTGGSLLVENETGNGGLNTTLADADSDNVTNVTEGQSVGDYKRNNAK